MERVNVEDINKRCKALSVTCGDSSPKGRAKVAFSTAPERTELLPMKNGNVPHCVIPTVAQAEWRNPPRGMMNHRKAKSATCVDSSTPFHSARNDMSEGGFVLSTRFIFAAQRNGT